jgi:hypothetical protein
VTTVARPRSAGPQNVPVDAAAVADPLPRRAARPLSLLPGWRPQSWASRERYGAGAAQPLLHRAEAEGRRLGERLAAICSREDAAAITTRQAADERIAVMEQHLAAVRALRGQHLEGGEGR